MYVIHLVSKNSSQTLSSVVHTWGGGGGDAYERGEDARHLT